MRNMDNIRQVDALINETYVYSVITVIFALIIAFTIAKMIDWEGGRSNNSYIKRRMWFIITGGVSAISFFLYNSLIVSERITKAPLEAKFNKTNLIATVGILSIYTIIGCLTMMMVRTSKWGSILGKTK
jgi:pheromone shutdown protein TraB